MNDKFLEFELRLLTLRYGRHELLHALARLGEQTPEELEQQIRRAEERRKAKPPRPAIMDLVAGECRERPEITELLRALAIKFENRVFLPNLRDVQRFLDRNDAVQGKLKSRNASAPVLCPCSR